MNEQVAEQLVFSRSNVASTLEYLAEAVRAVFVKTGLLPHLNPGLLEPSDFEALRPVSISQGIMLESVSERLWRRGGPHFGSPDKMPSQRLKTIDDASAASVPLMQGGIHPSYTGATYLKISRAVKEASPDVHLHAFFPLEVYQGAKTLGRSTLMDETISRSAGAQHGAEMTPQMMEDLITAAGRIPQQRTTLYDDAPEERYLASLRAGHAPLTPPTCDHVTSLG